MCVDCGLWFVFGVLLVWVWCLLVLLLDLPLGLLLVCVSCSWLGFDRSCWLFWLCFFVWCWLVGFCYLRLVCAGRWVASVNSVGGAHSLCFTFVLTLWLIAKWLVCLCLFILFPDEFILMSFLCCCVGLCCGGVCSFVFIV